MSSIHISNQIKVLIASLSQLEADIAQGNHLDFNKDKLKSIAIDLHKLADQITFENTIATQIIEQPIQKIEEIPEIEKSAEPVIPIQQVKVPVQEEKPKEEITETLDNTDVFPAEVQTEVIIPQAKVVEVNIPKAEEVIATKIVEVKKEIIAEAVTVNDKISKTAVPPQNIAEKLKETPIADLVKAIAISKKFEFINLLFDGNSDVYKQCIQTIQSSKDYNTAIQYLEQNILEQFDWQEHEKLAAEFFSLVRRRFL